MSETKCERCGVPCDVVHEVEVAQGDSGELFTVSVCTPCAIQGAVAELDRRIRRSGLTPHSIHVTFGRDEIVVGPAGVSRPNGAAVVWTKAVIVKLKERLAKLVEITIEANPDGVVGLSDEIEGLADLLLTGADEGAKEVRGANQSEGDKC